MVFSPSVYNSVPVVLRIGYATGYTDYDCCARIMCRICLKRMLAKQGVSSSLEEMPT